MQRVLYLITCAAPPAQRIGDFIVHAKVIEAHQHEDMEEVFYFLEGEVRMHIEEDVQPVTAGDRIIIPIQTVHILENTGNREMRFVCFGVKARPAEA